MLEAQDLPGALLLGLLKNPLWPELIDPKLAKALSKESFTKWLGEQPPEETYLYTDPMNCASAQYLRSIGLVTPSHPDLEAALGWQYIVLPGFGSGGRSTFGDAYLRARGGKVANFIKKLFWK